jgi:hypothetical protein
VEVTRYFKHGNEPSEPLMLIDLEDLCITNKWMDATRYKDVVYLHTVDIQ